MYEYKFHQVELSKLRSKPKEEYHEIIEKYASEGWRFVQIFAPSTTGYGGASYFELIFEKELSKN